MMFALGRMRILASIDLVKVRADLVRRTKAALIYKQPGNLRAVQFPLGHTEIVASLVSGRSFSRPLVSGPDPLRPLTLGNCRAIVGS